MSMKNRKQRPPADAIYNAARNYCTNKEGTRGWTLHATNGWKGHNIKPMKYRKDVPPLVGFMQRLAGLKGIVMAIDGPAEAAQRDK